MRNVLFIAYYFPPSGGSGVQRSLKFVKYLPAFGWRPIVLTVKPDSAAYPDLDEAMMQEVPPEAVVHRTRAWDPYSLYARWTGRPIEKAVTVGFLSDQKPTWRDGFARWVRGNIFLPDARVGWVPFASRAGARLLKKHPIDVIYSTGPPHSTHLIARKLRKRAGLPWVADFRDPWTEIDFKEELTMSESAQQRDAKLEHAVINEASRILCAYPSIARGLSPKTAAPCLTIYNGFDETDFADNPPQSSDIFTIAHVGNMNAARNPEALLRVLADLKASGDWDDACLKLVGNVDVAVMQYAERLGVADWIEHVPYVPHEEAIRCMQVSQILLLMVNRVKKAHDILPGKVFEYMAAGPPILAIGSPTGQVAEVLEDVGGGKMVDYEDEETLRQFLIKTRAEWKVGKSWSHRHPERVFHYSRKAQTEQLAALFNELAGVEG